MFKLLKSKGASKNGNMRVKTIKLHRITTFLAVIMAMIGGVLTFIGEIDRRLGLDIIPQSWETLAFVIGFAIIAIGVPSLIISIALSLFRIAESK